MNKLLIRDCYQQTKTIHKLMLTLADDLGDAAANYRPSPTDSADKRRELEILSDKVSEIEALYQLMRNQLDTLSR